MKIFFPLTSYYPSQIGGVSNTVFWHIEELEKNNINCSIVCTNIGIKNNEVSLNEFNKTKYGNIYYGKGGMFNLKILFKSFSQVKDNEVIHTNALFDPIGMLTFFFGKIFYPPLYLIEHRIYNYKLTSNNFPTILPTMEKRITIDLATINFMLDYPLFGVAEPDENV